MPEEEKPKTMLEEWRARQRRRGSQSQRSLTLKDVEKELGDHLHLVEIEEFPEGFKVSRRRYLSHEEFQEIHSIVKRLGGSYRVKEKDWLIPKAKPENKEEFGVRFEMAPIDALTPPERSIRFGEDEELDELVESIRRHGILQPILVRPRGQLYEVVAGERRLKAAKKAGLVEVPVIVREMSDEEVAFARLVENLQRKDLSAYEKAKAIKSLIDRGYSQVEIAEKLGMTKGRISQMLSILKLEGKFTVVNLINLSEWQVRAILKQPEEIWEELGREIERYRVEKGELPSAAEIERMAQRIEVSRMKTAEELLAERLAEEQLKRMAQPRVERPVEVEAEAEVEEVSVEEAVKPAKPIRRFIEELYELFPDAGEDYIIDHIVEEYGVGEEEALRELNLYKMEKAVEKEKFIDYVVCRLCGAWMPRSSGDPVLPEEMKRHLRDVHFWRPGPGGEYIDGVSWQSWKPDGKSLQELNEELTRGYWLCNFCKAWMPGYDKIIPEPVKQHLKEEHNLEPLHGAWGEALTFSEIAPGEGRRLDRERKERKMGEFVADFKCPICGYRAVIIHIDEETHKLQRIREG